MAVFKCKVLQTLPHQTFTSLSLNKSLEEDQQKAVRIDGSDMFYTVVKYNQVHAPSHLY